MAWMQNRRTPGVRLGRVVIVAFAALVTACSGGATGGSPEEQNLREGMRDMEANIRSQTYKDLLQAAGSPSSPSAGVQVLFSSAAAANWKTPPEGIGFSPEGPTKTWIVVVRGDDAGSAIVLEGYGEDRTKPLMTERVPYPPN